MCYSMTQALALQMPQPVEPSGGQRGTGSALTLPLTDVAEFSMCEEAKAPVTTSDRTNARTMFFMV